MTYPTSEQLQQLRDAYAEARGMEIFGPEDGGAWEGERAAGIGYRGAVHGIVPDLSWSMRRWIGEMRERVYPGISGSAVDELERTFGIPYAWRMTLDEWPELPQPTWGEALGVDEGAAFYAEAQDG